MEDTHNVISDKLSKLPNCDWLLWRNAQQYGLSTIGSKHLFVGVIKPRIRQAISSVLSLANELAFHIIPVSSNKNWGYGLSTNAEKPVVLMDLQALNAIIDTDKSLGLITLEPGVTQQMLSDYLEQNGWDYMVPVTGAGPHCSIVSNALERGYGITPHADHFQACTALKAFLAHPDYCEQEYQSAVSDLDNSGDDFIDKSFKWGLGPFLDGIFTQSNMGIVTEMTFRLAQRPEGFCAFYIQIFNPNLFEDGVAFIKRIMQTFAGNIGSVNYMDRRRLLSMTVDNPNLHKDSDTYLSDVQVDELAKQNRTPHWLIVGSIYGTQDIVDAVKKSIKKSAKPLGQVLFSDSLIISFGKKVANSVLAKVPLIQKLKTQLDTIDEGIGIMLGKPNQVALPLAYWRNREITPDKNLRLNPAADGCGLLWYAPLVRMNPQVLEQFVYFVRSTLHKFDLDPFITFTNLRHDCIDSTVPIVFNLKSKSETERAKKCLSELIDKGREHGFVPYRLSAEEQIRLNKSSIYWDTVKHIKTALDPNGIISPGRYS